MLEAFAGFAARRLGWDVDVEQVALVTDVMVGIQELVRELTEPGDGVILSTPAYPPYFRELGRPLVEVPLLDGGALDIDGIDAAFAAGARAMVLCNPHNPTGRVAPREELEALAAVADAHGAWVIADEIHAPLTFPGETFVPWLTVAPRGVALTSASKAFNLTALKLGLIVGEPVARLSADLRDHAGYLGVIAAEAAFRDGDEWLDETLATIAANHAALPSLLPDGIVAAPRAGELPGVAGLPRGGARRRSRRGVPRARPGRADRRAGLRRAGRGLRAAQRRDEPGAARRGGQAPGGGVDAVKRRTGSSTTSTVPSSTTSTTWRAASAR